MTFIGHTHCCKSFFWVIEIHCVFIQLFYVYICVFVCKDIRCEEVGGKAIARKIGKGSLIWNHFTQSIDISCLLLHALHCKKWGAVLHLIWSSTASFSEHLLNFPFAAKLFHLGSSTYKYLLVMCSVSTNGERAGLGNSKLTIDSWLECS